MTEFVTKNGVRISRSLHAAAMRFLGHGVDNSWRGSAHSEDQDKIERQWERTKTRFFERIAKLEKDNADLLVQNQRLQDHVDTHHKYFEELHELARAQKDKCQSGDERRFVLRVFGLTHPNTGERG